MTSGGKRWRLKHIFSIPEGYTEEPTKVRALNVTMPPEILPYAITSICPIGADVRQLELKNYSANPVSVVKSLTRIFEFIRGGKT